MRILVIGATGLLGRAVVDALRGHDVVAASHQRAPERVDILDPSSIRALYARVGRVDGVVCCAGMARWKPLADLDDADWAFSLAHKLQGQLNVVRYGVDAVSDGGSFTLTSGQLAQHPAPGSAALTVVNAGIEAFARAAALELPRGQRINVVSPGWVAETLARTGQDPSSGTPAAVVAQAYVRLLTGSATGTVVAA